MKLTAAVAAVLVVAIAQFACAQSVATQSPLAGLTFLIGDWSSGRGEVADTGGTSTGRSAMTSEAGGAVILRRDHTDLFDKSGRPMGGFDQIMMIYPEAGTIRADYSDGAHVIHYVSATVEPGAAATFTSIASAGAPTFRLSYRLTAPDRLSVWFGMAPPGGGDFRPIAVGELRKRS
ncbi:MAG TPA: hypothetical protein VGG92_10590 [Caulobacteraceae bacterium]|jgi:hypothetical protein